MASSTPQPEKPASASAQSADDLLSELAEKEVDKLVASAQSVEEVATTQDAEGDATTDVDIDSAQDAALDEIFRSTASFEPPAPPPQPTTPPPPSAAEAAPATVAIAAANATDAAESPADEETLARLASSDLDALDTADEPTPAAPAATQPPAGQAESAPGTLAELDALFSALTDADKKNLEEGLREEEAAEVTAEAPDVGGVGGEPGLTVPPPAAPLEGADAPDPAEAFLRSAEGEHAESADHGRAAADHAAADAGASSDVTSHGADPARAALLAIESQPAGPKVSLGDRVIDLLALINRPFLALGDGARNVAGAFGLASLMIGVPLIVWRLWVYRGG